MTEKNKKEFHITITNNVTGEIECDVDTNCILASILLDKGGTAIVQRIAGDENDEGKQNEEN